MILHNYDPLGQGYNPTDFSNVEVRSHMSFTSDVLPEMIALVTQVHWKKPTWHFVCLANNVLAIYEEQGGEQIASVEWSRSSRNHWTGGMKYHIQSKQVEKAVMRGNHKETNDIKKAIKIILSLVRPKTQQERNAEALSRITAALHDSRYYAQTHRRDALEAVMPYLVNTLDNPTVTKVLLLQEGMTEEMLTKYMDTQEVFERRGAMSMEAGAMFIAEDECYRVYNEDYAREYWGKQGMVGDMIAVTAKINASDLPTSIKAKLGMLKVSPEKEFIPDVGLRLARGVYFISDIAKETYNLLEKVGGSDE